jgi:hypothetical protein
LLKRDGEDAEVLYARGEVYRLRDDKDDLDRSLADLSRAGMVIKAPAETFRSLGMVHRRRADRDAAVQSFEKYLAMAPDAADAGLVKSYLSELKP